MFTPVRRYGRIDSGLRVVRPEGDANGNRRQAETVPVTKLAARRVRGLLKSD
jgi:hypothetical protein